MVWSWLLQWWSDGRQSTDAADDEPSKSSRDLRIVRHLKGRGGRTTQSDIVRHFNVSKATISRDLSELEADGVIARHRNGRQNIVDLETDRAVEALAERDGSRVTNSALYEELASEDTP